MYRYRPYQVRRALQCSNDVTSSFPSRCVLCAVVFAYAFCYGFCYYARGGVFQYEAWMGFLLAGAVLISSFARVNLGMHYPSDCAAGALLGAVVVAVTVLLHRGDSLGCTPCDGGQCYTERGSSRVIDVMNLQRLDVPVAIGFTLLSFGIAAVSSSPPLRFWSKCPHVYGMLLPCVLFRFACLCPPLNPFMASVASVPSSSAVPAVLVSLTVAGTAAFVGMRAARKVGDAIARFSAIYALVFITLLVWRGL